MGLGIERAVPVNPVVQVEYRIYGYDGRGYYSRVADTIDALRRIVTTSPDGEIEQIVEVVTTRTTINSPGRNVCDELEGRNE